MAITRAARRQMATYKLRSGKVVASLQTTYRHRRPSSVPALRKSKASIIDHEMSSSSAPGIIAEPADVENFLTQSCSSTTEAYSADLPMSTITPLISPISSDRLAKGLPENGEWDQDDALAQRFCFRHGETEYLLSTPDRWMNARDFERADAAKRLEARYNQYLISPGHRDHHAECIGQLWSHVGSVVGKREIESHVWYRVHWKQCWTPSSLIDDVSWVESCLKVHEKGKRRSTRLMSTTGFRASVNEAIMTVVRIG